MKPMMAVSRSRLPPEPVGEIAGERHHHGGGDDVGGQHPGDLVGRGGEGAEHMRDRHVDDGHVEHFEHRGQHHGDDERDRRTLGMQARERPGAAARRAACPLRPLPPPRFGAAHFGLVPASVVSMVTVGAGAHAQRLVGVGRAR